MSDSVFDVINRRFLSGNDVCVERAHIKAEEWAKAQSELTAAKAENEALRGRVAELEATIYAACKGDPDGICDEENWEYAYTMLFDVLRSTRNNAWLLRKQAEAVDVVADRLKTSTRWGFDPFRRGLNTAYGHITGSAQLLRQQAEAAEQE